MFIYFTNCSPKVIGTGSWKIYADADYKTDNQANTMNVTLSKLLLRFIAVKIKQVYDLSSYKLFQKTMFVLI